MIAAQDIDALLISALYGELTPADEARLAAHLESHPTDRTALDDLTHARSVVRESRIFQVQLEPPQAISALLLQEAARRAPKKVVQREENESWFYRFTRSFMSHPAMAAAAMLVLVVGVAGTLYLKNGAQVAEESAPALTQAQEVAAPAGAPRHGDDLHSRDEGAAGAAGGKDRSGYAAGSGSAVTAAGSAFGADLAERKFESQKQVETERALAKNAEKDADQDGKLDKGTVVDTTKSKVAQHSPAPAHEGVIVKPPPQMAPREMPPEAKKPAMIASDDTNSDHQQVAAGRNAPGGPANGNAAPSPPPPAQPTTAAPAASTQQRERQADKPADATVANNNDSTLVAWAKDQHVRVQALVKAGKCQDAAKVALDISAKAPEYYAQYVATDRTVKPCASYINDARDKEAEKSQKARAQKRVNANEPAPAPLDLK